MIDTGSIVLKDSDGPRPVKIALATAYTKAGRKEDAAKEREAFAKLRKEIDAKTGPGAK